MRVIWTRTNGKKLPTTARYNNNNKTVGIDRKTVLYINICIQTVHYAGIYRR